MPIVVMTRAEQIVLQDILEVHLDGLKVSKQTIIKEEKQDYLLEAVAAVDEAIARTETLIGRVNRGC
jgi:hypothetical protein